jgi:hypothetical protein
VLCGQELAPSPRTLTITDGTAVKLRLNQTISSSHAHIGDHLEFMVLKDVAIEGRIIIPAGTIASGSVIRVKGKRFLGIGGNVAFTLDSVPLVTGGRVILQARMEVKGPSRTKLMAAGMIGAGLVFWPVAPVFLLSRGCDSTALKGTEITGHVRGQLIVQAASFSPAREGASELKNAMIFAPRRVLNGEGREGDMVNLLFVSQKDDLQQAFERGGWVKTDKWRPVMAWHLLTHRTRDARLPMARFYMFGRTQDYSYALPDPAAIVSRRHHVRIWKTGYEVSGNPIWVGAATHDVAIEFWTHGHLINHRIDPQVDAERDFIGRDLTATLMVGYQKYIEAIDPVFKAETASGGTYYSDSRILLLDLSQVQTRSADPPAAMSPPSILLIAPASVEMTRNSLLPTH